MFATHANILTIVQTNKHTAAWERSCGGKDGVALTGANSEARGMPDAAPDTVRECSVGDADRNTHSKH